MNRSAVPINVNITVAGIERPRERPKDCTQLHDTGRWGGDEVGPTKELDALDELVPVVVVTMAGGMESV